MSALVVLITLGVALVGSFAYCRVTGKSLSFRVFGVRLEIYRV